VNTRPNPATDLDIRSLRYFVAVADDLHFTRAAARLFVAQQALSREIRRLETQLGVPLLVRTTRKVGLTPEGQDFLERARELISLHDQLLAGVKQPTRPVLVDLMSEGRQTAFRILEAARDLEPDLEFRGRHGGSMGSSFRRLEGGELDVAFGRAEWRGQGPSRGLSRRLVRYEALAVLVPLGHPLARQSEVATRDLKGLEIDANPATPDAFDWADLAGQFLELCGAYATPDHVSAVGLDDQAHHLVQQGLPILTTVDHVDVAGGALLPIVDPVPIYVWSMVWRGGSHARGVDALRRAAIAVGDQERWLDLPDGAWLPKPEASNHP
jgi:DNA-binding transcriptional LysR family regulator